ncbi:MAG TPA: hypothetical protein VNF68_14805 [Candidatus Baltobacteraceae bacterium]|nr:hypothetical protein [Candidatus Baltobacteraceae bacterium]
MAASRAKQILFANGKNAAKQLKAYPALGSGNLAPTTLIAGSKTMLDVPALAFVAPSGRVFTCNYFTGEILGYAAAARGNVAPLRRIAGSNDPIRLCRAVVVDGTGRIAGAGAAKPGEPDAVYVWGPVARGNVKPNATISGNATKLGMPSALVFGPNGILYVANYEASTVTAYARNANGNVAPLRVLGGSRTQLNRPVAMALRSGMLYVVNVSNASITAYRVSQNGDVSPTIAISGSKTSLASPSGIALDAAGFLYVSNRAPNGKGYLTVYAPGADGNVAPVQTIRGSNVDVIGQIAVR